MSIIVEEFRDHETGNLPDMLIRGAKPSRVAGIAGIQLDENEQIFVLRWLTMNRRHLVERIEWERTMIK
jgi:hypothetical protein